MKQKDIQIKMMKERENQKYIQIKMMKEKETEIKRVKEKRAKLKERKRGREKEVFGHPCRKIKCDRKEKTFEE